MKLNDNCKLMGFQENQSFTINIQVHCSGGSRPSDKQVGGGHPDPEIRGGGLKKNFFGPSGFSLVKK